MINLHLENLNTFGKGRWEFLPSKFSCAESYEDNCNKLYKYSQNTPLCLCEMKHVKEGLEENDFFVFIDNQNNLQIVGDINAFGWLNGFRGVADDIEQNIDLKYLDVANDFCDKNVGVRFCKNWKYQTNWLARLHQYVDLFKQKKYDQINVENLIDDLGYNGYNLHYKDCTKESKKRIYYPMIKRELISQSMLKPMIASHLGCKTNEFFVGKYAGNDKNIKYIVGDCISQYLSEDCRIEKVFGSIKIKKYFGKADLFAVPTTGSFDVSGEGVLSFNIEDFFKKAPPLSNEEEMFKKE